MTNIKPGDSAPSREGRYETRPQRKRSRGIILNRISTVIGGAQGVSLDGNAASF